MTLSIIDHKCENSNPQSPIRAEGIPSGQSEINTYNDQAYKAHLS
jgi:hypothetical protein